MMYFAFIRSFTFYYSIEERKILGKGLFAIVTSDAKVAPVNETFLSHFGEFPTFAWIRHNAILQLK